MKIFKKFSTELAIVNSFTSECGEIFAFSGISGLCEGGELVNRCTHGIGALVSLIWVIALITLASRQHDSYRVVSAFIYGGAMVTFYCL